MDVLDAPLPPRRLDGLLIVTFLTAIALPGAVGLIDRDAVDAIVTQERRQPAPFPERPADARALGGWPAAFAAAFPADFPAAFEAWFDDRFGLRRSLIRWHNLLKLRVLGVSPIPRMIVGEDGWQFIGYDDYVEGYRGTRPFPPALLEAWGRSIQFKSRWLAKHGIRYVFAVAPSKSTIYPERMPAHLGVVSERRRHDELLDHLRAHTDVATVDLRPALLAAKDRYAVPLYYPHGSHWNDLGAYVAARELVRAVRRWIPGLAITPLCHYDVRVHEDGGDDTWASRLYVDDVFSQTWVRLVRARAPFFKAVELGRDEGQVLSFDNERADLPRAVLLRDSFGTAIAPLLAPHFAHLRCFWQWYMDPEALPGAILEAQPDVVIDLVVERLLGTVEAPPYAYGDP